MKIILTLTSEISNDLYLVKIIKVKGGTGKLDVKVSSAITRKLKKWVRVFSLKPNVERETRIRRNLDMAKLTMGSTVSALSMIKGFKIMDDGDLRMQSKIDFFTNFGERDLKDLEYFQRCINPK